MANGFVNRSTTTIIYKNSKAKELIFVNSWKHFCLQEVQVLQNCKTKNYGYAKVGYIYLDKTTSQRVARMWSWNTNLKPKHLQRGFYCASCLTANAHHVVGTPIKTLKKERKNIHLTDQIMWSSVLRREAYIKYCTHANNLELAIAQHNTYLTCLTCHKLHVR